LESFKGVNRRFEIKGEKFGAIFVDDYGHHPNEIKNVLEVARGIGKRVITVFQPHRYTRTMELYREFGEVLSKSDIVILLPIYPAGEKPIPGVSSELIYGVMKGMGKDGVYLVETFEEAAEILRKILEEGDVVLLQGAGNVYRVFDIV